MDVILVAGLWLDGSAWDDVAPALERLGHRPVPLTLPGQGAGTSATLDDQLAAVVAAIDAAVGSAVVVGHSAACALAWMAADARPDRVAAVAMIGGFPTEDGETYADFFPVVDGVVPFPGWEPFEGDDTADMDEEARRRMESLVHPVPGSVAQGTVRLADERRHRVPLVMVCTEFSPAQAQEWVEAGEVPELSRAQALEYVDLDSGHWPMFTRPEELARIIAEVADRHAG